MSNNSEIVTTPSRQVLINEQSLRDTAYAIRERENRPVKLKPSQFSKEIFSQVYNVIGGDRTEEIDLSVEEKDVNFYDYDGTRVYSYGKEEFLGLSSLPDNPSHDNLIAQGWNWSLSDAKEYVQNYGILDVGQLYNTSTGATEIDIELKEGYLSPTLKIKSGGGLSTNVTVNWGDNTSSSLGTTNSGNEGTVLSTSHTYNTPGRYTISIETDEIGYANTGSLIFYGDYKSNGDIEYTYLLTDSNESKAQVYRNSIVNIRLGQLIKKITMGGLSACRSLKNVVFSNTTIDLTDAFWNCSSLRTIIFPKNITTPSGSGLESNFINCYSLKRVIYSKNNVNVNKYGFFQQCYSLQKLCFPNITTIFNDNFKNCYSLKQLIIPNTVSSFGNYCFQNCYSLKTINCYPTTPPTVTSTTFTGLPTYTKIYVPWSRGHSILQAYKTATYWSAIADQIYQMPISIENTQAYAQFDSSDGSLTFFRDIPGKHTNNQVNGTKTYYTGIETTNYASISNVPWYSSRTSVTSVTFENEIVPISTACWFYGMNNVSFTSITSLDKLDTSNVTSMYSMFFSCSSITSLDLSNFNTSNVTNMSDMFGICNSLTSLDVSNFNTSNATNMSGMFRNCFTLTNLDLSNFNTSNVTDMRYMFYNCNKLTSLNLSSFNTSNVTIMSAMFSCCSVLTTIYVSDTWDVSGITSSYNMFIDCTNLVGGNGTIYDSSYIDKTYARIDASGTPGYLTYKAATGGAS